MGSFDYGGWAPYTSVAERRRQAERMLSELKRKGRLCSPVRIAARAIATTFWGKGWCSNLERYSDYANRLPRGRSYVRHGAVVDLQIEPGKILALVSGSALYEVAINVDPLNEARWNGLRAKCAGKVASVIELLQGRLSNAVMEEVTRPGTGLFPDPQQIKFRCSCPDSSLMCKHVAAVLYGVGARFDQQPELLFRLRHIDPQMLLQHASDLTMVQPNRTYRQLETADLSNLFGIDLDDPTFAADLPTASPAAKHARKQQGLKQSPNANARPDASPIELSKTSIAPIRKKHRKTTRARELLDRGIPRHMIQSGLNAGWLLHTDQRGLYGTTKDTESRIQRYLERRAMSHKANQR